MSGNVIALRKVCLNVDYDEVSAISRDLAYLSFVKVESLASKLGRAVERSSESLRGNVYVRIRPSDKMRDLLRSDDLFDIEVTDTDGIVRKLEPLITSDT